MYLLKLHSVNKLSRKWKNGVSPWGWLKLPVDKALVSGCWWWRDISWATHHMVNWNGEQSFSFLSIGHLPPPGKYISDMPNCQFEGIMCDQSAWNCSEIMARFYGKVWNIPPQSMKFNPSKSGTVLKLNFWKRLAMFRLQCLTVWYWNVYMPTHSNIQYCKILCFCWQNKLMKIHEKNPGHFVCRRVEQ